jgi:hypothetical protein
MILHSVETNLQQIKEFYLIASKISLKRFQLLTNDMLHADYKPSHYNRSQLAIMTIIQRSMITGILLYLKNKTSELTIYL